MKTQPGTLVTLLLLVLLAAGCAAPTPQPTAVQDLAAQPEVMPASQANTDATQNTEVVLKMVERLNAGDVEGSLAYFADDALVYLMGLPPTGIEFYQGKEQIRTLWQDSVANHFEWDVKVASTYGDMVNVQSKTWHDFTRQLEVAPLEYLDIYEVVGGKIQTYGSWLTEESLARFKPAFTAVMPPEEAAEPFSGTPASEITVTTAGGTCTTGSLPALQAGEVTVTWTVEDQDQSMYALTMFTLDSGKDMLDLMVSTAGNPPSWGDMVYFEELGPGESQTETFRLAEGPLYIICWSKPPDLPVGNLGPILVVP